VVSIYPGLPLSEMKTVVNTRVTEVQPLKMKAGACSFLAFCTQSLKERTAKTNNIPLKAAFEEESRMLDAKGIIFDIDGTLADSWKLGFDATQVILEKHGIPLITEETYHECTRYATPDRLARHAGLMPGDAGYEEKGKILASEFDDLYVGLVSTETAPFFPGIAKLLEDIPSGVAVGALTNAAERYAHAVFKVNCEGKIYERFKSVRGADTVPKPKPSPDGLFLVSKEMGLSPVDCVYIGDSPSDGLAANAAGMTSVAVLWGSHSEVNLRSAPFTHCCKTTEDLRTLLC